jgi:hypothetical protein
MSDRRRKPGASGRVTPKGGPSASSPRRSRPDPEEPVQIGRRPSNPFFLLIVGFMWVAVGLIILFAATFRWRFVVAIVAIGIGLFFLRGAGATVVRRDQRRSGR